MKITSSIDEAIPPYRIHYYSITGPVSVFRDEISHRSISLDHYCQEMFLNQMRKIQSFSRSSREPSSHGL